MTPPPHRTLIEVGVSVLASARFTQALTVAILGTAFLSSTVKATMGWEGLIGALVCLVVLAGASLAVSREEIEWRGLLPISLILFIGWCGATILWSDYQWATLGSIAYQVAFASLGVFVALRRDLIQIVRAVGDVLRTVLVASLALEVLVGILLDTSAPFLRIDGSLADGGPIQGLLGTRNQLGLVAVIALITFSIELVTRSADRGLAVGSIVLAALSVWFTGSPVSLGVLAAVAVTSAVLVWLRRLDPDPRRVAQFALLGTTVFVLTAAFVFRSRLIAVLDAGSEFEFRYSLWLDVVERAATRTVEGFGWLGLWRRDLPPYIGIDPFGPAHSSALNAYLDVLLQTGIVGLFAFIALLGLTLVRSWLLASNKRSVVFAWVPLVLVALILTSAAESSILVEFGWLLLVICCVRSAHELSWRSRLPEA
ncbi:O-antigen ligase family protein [Marisediminicola sp. LYQ134]|uniref:O-antigen ligase family protein n=1 Tax=unclassified Marisediminicola TaxID=2618316 RepID=UPI0039836A85